MTRYAEYQREMAYRIFVTDGLYVSEDNKRIVHDQRYSEWLGFTEKDERTGDEIAAEIIKKAGLVVE